MSKSRSDRGKTPAQVPAHPPTVVLNEVVPGRMTENDWGFMVDSEIAEDFLEDLLLDVVNKALDIISNKILEARVIPYSVESAREMLIELVEWQFLERDNGEVNEDTDISWVEENEPQTGIIDSWAQGAVPVAKENLRTIPDPDGEKVEDSRTLAFKEENLEIYENSEVARESVLSSFQRSDTEEPKTTESTCAITSTEGSVKNTDEQLNKLNRDEELAIDTVENKRTGTVGFDASESCIKEKRSEQAKKPPAKHIKRYKGKVPEFQPIILTPVASENAVSSGAHIIPSNSGNSSKAFQHGHPPISKGVTFDETGNVVMVQKLKVEKLPSHRIKTQFAVVDPVEEDIKAKLFNKKQKHTSGKDKRGKLQNHPVGVPSKTILTSGKSDIFAASLPTPLVDLMNVSKGVAVNEGGTLRRGISKGQRKQEMSHGRLCPIQSESYGLTLTPTDLLSERSPVVRQLPNAHAPLPAISQGQTPMT